jgi:hypothetical protein
MATRVSATSAIRRGVLKQPETLLKKSLMIVDEIMLAP